LSSTPWSGNILSPEERSRMEKLMAAAGADAGEEAPLVWLRMESQETSGTGPPMVRWQGFPGDEDRILATSEYHAPAVEWF
jgi:hypothetical protein